MSLIKLKYPIGKYARPDNITDVILTQWISDIETLPQRLTDSLQHLNDEQLDTPYRPDGWTVRQLVHHIADSHLNAHTRIRLALTELSPAIRPYDQDEWGKLPDANRLPVSYSLSIINGLHARWAYLLKQLKTDDLLRKWLHPEYGETYDVYDLIGMYAWHGDHHLAQINGLFKQREGW